MGYYWELITHLNDRTAAPIEKAKKTVHNVKLWCEYYNKWIPLQKIPKSVIDSLDASAWLIGKSQKAGGYINELEKIHKILNSIVVIGKISPRTDAVSRQLAALYGALLVQTSKYLTGFPGASEYGTIVANIGSHFVEIYGVFAMQGSSQFTSEQLQAIMDVKTTGNI